VVTHDATREGAAPLVRVRDRSKHVLAALATVMALWFGLTAPSVSPVSAATPPPATAPATSTQTPQDTGGGVQLVPPPDLRGGGGR
jgi:hypothetical protein